MRLIVAFALLLLTGCSSGIGDTERLGWYVPFVPDDLVIERFYETPSPSMDHEYMWKIKIVDNDEFRKFEQQFTVGPPNQDGVNDLIGACVFDTHPNWWKNVNFGVGVLYKYRVSVGGNGNEWANIFALFDRDAGCLYVQAFRLP